MTPPADFRHASLEPRLASRRLEHVDDLDLGYVLGSSATFDLPSGDTLEPDVSFVSHGRLAGGPAPQPGRNIRIVPDLVIGILSKSTAERDRGVKKEIYAANGVREYWLVDPSSRTVTVFVERGGAFADSAPLAGGRIASEVLPGLELSVEEVFRRLWVTDPR